MNKNSKSNSSRLDSIWLTVLLLIMLVLASACLLGTFIKRYVAGEKNVIAVMADSNAMKEQYNADSFPSGAEPSMNASWETETSVDLFKNAYTDADGNVTVESANGDKVIAPGTSNTYDFTLKNTGNISLDYSLVLDGIFKISDMDLPFYVRLRQGNTWITGGEDEWVHVKDLSTVVENATLPRDESITYVFEWMWPYETDDEANILIDNLNDTLIATDKNDTALGDVAVDVKADFRLNINLTTVVTPGTIPVFADGTSVMQDFLLVLVSAGSILLSGLWLMLLFFRRKIYVTGIVEPSLAEKAKLGNKTSDIDKDRIIFPKARFGKHTLSLDKYTCVIRFKSRKVEGGVRFEVNDNKYTIVVDRKIRAVELYVNKESTSDNITICQDKWAAIDKKHNVYVAGRIIPPVENCNTTPGGLSIDKDGKLFISTTTEGL